jgi:oleate hydratase
LANISIEDYFGKEFLKTNLWNEFCTVFAFQSWHSLIEFRRYLFRSIHVLKYLNTLEPVVITPYNQYESLVLPIISWLEKQGVNFIKDTKITDL